MRGGVCIAYGANSFMKVAPATEDRVGSQSLPSECNAVKIVKSCARQPVKGLQQLISTTIHWSQNELVIPIII